jgi:hypothetical protein
MRAFKFILFSSICLWLFCLYFYLWFIFLLRQLSLARPLTKLFFSQSKYSVRPAYIIQFTLQPSCKKQNVLSFCGQHAYFYEILPLSCYYCTHCENCYSFYFILLTVYLSFFPTSASLSFLMVICLAMLPFLVVFLFYISVSFFIHIFL